MVYTLILPLDAWGEQPVSPRNTPTPSRLSSIPSHEPTPRISQQQFSPRLSGSPQYCGNSLLPVVIDTTAHQDPERIWASLPYDDEDLSKGYENINYARLAGAINKLAWLIALAIGTSSSFETIAYYGGPDIRYPLMVMAACKTGHKVLFPQPTSTADTHIRLMEHLQCKAVLSASAVDVSHLLERRPVPHFIIPELDHLLNESEGVEPFYYTKTFAEAQLDPLFVLNASSTECMPQSVIYTHAMAAAVDTHRLLPSIEGGSNWLSPGPATRILLPLPPHDPMIANLALNMSVFGGGVIVPGFRLRAVEVGDICNIIRHSKVNVGILPPWALEDMAGRQGGERYMKHFDRVFYACATLSSLAAHKWAQHTILQSFWDMPDTSTSSV